MICPYAEPLAAPGTKSVGYRQIILGYRRWPLTLVQDLSSATSLVLLHWSMYLRGHEPIHLLWLVWHWGNIWPLTSKSSRSLMRDLHLCVFSFVESIQGFGFRIGHASWLCMFNATGFHSPAKPKDDVLLCICNRAYRICLHVKSILLLSFLFTFCRLLIG
jgi:hypothetical protein